MIQPIQRETTDNGSSTRAEQRKQRLLDAETELAKEEAEALKLTEEQRQTLLRPFATVKAEFSDLDGLRWTQTALRRLQSTTQRSLHSASHPPVSPTKNALFFLSAFDSPPSSPEATVRATSPRYTSAKPSAQISPSHRRRDGLRSRSPIKGLFSRSQSTESSPAVQIAVLEADITDASDDSGVDEDAVHISRYSCASRNARRCSFGPPGLTPPREVLFQDSPTKNPKAPKFVSASDFPTVPTTHVPNVTLDVQPQPCPVAPFPHRDAPSPPPSSQQPCPVPSITISAPTTPSDTPTVRAHASRVPAPAVATAIRFKSHQPRPTARTRLHSLLKDVRQGRISASVPTSPRPRPTRSATHPPPIELTASPESRDLTELDFFYEEDCLTPRPSPITERCRIPTIPNVQAISY